MRKAGASDQHREHKNKVVMTSLGRDSGRVFDGGKATVFPARMTRARAILNERREGKLEGEEKPRTRLRTVTVYLRNYRSKLWISTLT